MLSARFDLSKNTKSVVELNQIQSRACADLIGAIESGKMAFADLACPICGGRDFVPIATRDRYGVPARFVICRTCSLLQTNPYLDENSTNRFYAEVFAPLHRGSDQPTAAKFESRRRYGAGIARWLISQDVKPPRLIVDVGCSSGGVLQGMIDAGFRGIGIDVAADYVADARQRGLEAVVGSLDDLKLPEPPDVIAYCQSLEHIVPINEELARISRAAGPETLIYVEVPGLFQLFPTYHFDLLRYLQLAHVWHFSPYTLKRLFAHHGFEQIAGDGYIRAIFRKAKQPVDVGPAPSAEEVISRLRSTERIRALYPLKLLRSLKRVVKG
ncbi:class I SAM-dependent methyltransferase [Tistrella mobilis]|uniref:class I SAM-dependent methyltransferase n=1 Tax=Tistrella mobilis TaxID=171437 RepID=UPI003558C7FD